MSARATPASRRRCAAIRAAASRDRSSPRRISCGETLVADGLPGDGSKRTIGLEFDVEFRLLADVGAWLRRVSVGFERERVGNVETVGRFPQGRELLAVDLDLENALGLPEVNPCHRGVAGQSEASLGETEGLVGKGRVRCRFGIPGSRYLDVLDLTRKDLRCLLGGARLGTEHHEDAGSRICVPDDGGAPARFAGLGGTENPAGRRVPQFGVLAGHREVEGDGGTLLVRRMRGEEADGAVLERAAGIGLVRGLARTEEVATARDVPDQFLRARPCGIAGDVILAGEQRRIVLELERSDVSGRLLGGFGLGVGRRVLESILQFAANGGERQCGGYECKCEFVDVHVGIIAKPPRSRWFFDIILANDVKGRVMWVSVRK